MVINRLWAIVLAFALLIGVWLRSAPLALAGAFGLLLGGLELLWTERCFEGVSYERKLDVTQASFGQSVQLTLRFANRKLLPLTWVEADDRVPDQLPIEPGTTVRGGLAARSLHLRNLLRLLPYEQVTRRYSIHCRRRGVFEFGPSWLETGDLLGYASRVQEYTRVDRLMVYPKVFELDLPPPRAQRLIGRQRADRVILTDPSRMVGVRSYQTGDPLRHVEWRSSARAGELLVRVFEPTTEPALAIFLDFNTPGDYWRDDTQPELEFAISLAASLAKWANDRHYPFGLFGNGSRGDLGGAVRVPLASDPEQFRRVLEILALALPYHETSIGPLLSREAARLPAEASVVLVTAALDPDLAPWLHGVRGRALTVLAVSSSFGCASLPGVPVVPVPYLDGWTELEHVALHA
ncbi:MAG: DUF58 domain-containing protein [Chloroflexi bacterium]|nr:DUF58 domain-containing protein [Chloroflexota bacterium]